MELESGLSYFWYAILLLSTGSCLFFAILPFATTINQTMLRYTVGERDKIHGKLEDIFIQISPQKLLNILLGFCLTLGLISFLVFLPNFIVGLILFPIVTVSTWFIPGFALDLYIKQRINKFNVQLIDGLTLMSSGLKAGQSITQAMELLVREMPNPIKQEFEQILKQNRLGLSIEEALQYLPVKIRSDECQMLVTSVAVIYSSGASLAETFGTIAYTIRERIKLEQKIQGMTAMGRTQGALIFSLPVVVMLMNYSTDPEAVTAMLNSGLGLLLMGVCFVFHLIGGFALWKVTQIKI